MKDIESLMVLYSVSNIRLDATYEDGSMGRLVNDNHKDSNCTMKLIEVDSKPYLCLFATRNIQGKEEIRYNYGTGSFPWRKKVIKVSCSPT